jgi:N-hydroxyarylamine O-acetyltransferase
MNCSGEELVPDRLLRAVLERLGVATPVSLTVDGLDNVFKAWCRVTGYDNVGLAVRAGAGGTGPVLGFPAHDYFDRLLAHGMSNLCFGNSEALRAVLDALGFTVARVRGSMGSSEAVLGAYKHGSLLVTIDGQRYVVDPTFMAEKALLWQPGVRTTAGSGALRIWTDIDGAIRWQIPQGRFNAVFKIEEIDCSFEVFREEHQKTQQGLAHGRLYKHKLFVRRNVAGGTRTYDNGAIITKADGQFLIRKISGEELIRAFVEDFGLSAEVVASMPTSYYEHDGNPRARTNSDTVGG